MKTAKECRLAAHRAQMRAAAMEWRAERLEPMDWIMGQEPGEQAKFYLGIAKDYREMSKISEQAPAVSIPL